MIFREPMTAYNKPYDLNEIRFPILAQLKLDGIRCIVINGTAFTRTMKLVPNWYIRFKLGLIKCPLILDGELLLTKPNATFQEITSAIMREDGEPDFHYYIFDNYQKSRGYLARMDSCQFIQPYYSTLGWTICNNVEDILVKEELALKEGYEGIIIRSPNGLYKQGRSTFKEQYLLKLKRFTDAEAEVLGMEPLMVNTNEQETDERGYAKRSKEKAG
jgi:DNA ligase-1